MKKYVDLLVLIVLLLTACNRNAVKQVSYSNPPAAADEQKEREISSADEISISKDTSIKEIPTDPPDEAHERIEREISSSDILRISEDMTYKEIYELLGGTLSYFRTNASPSIFSYIVDGDMRYTQTFSRWTDVCGLTGENILTTIKEENTEIAPCFDGPGAACEEIKSAVFGSRGWQIIFANDSYVYATYSEYGPYILRYNIKANSVDRALNIKGLSRYFPNVECAINFTEDGRYMILRNNIERFIWAPIFDKVRLPFPAMYVYGIDFDENQVSLLSDTQDGWSLPDGYAYKLQSETRYRLGYNEEEEQRFFDGEHVLSLSVLDGYYVDSYALAAIDDDTIAIMLYPQGEGLELGYYVFAVVNPRENKLIGKCAVNVKP